jgi:hypothetical protein
MLLITMAPKARHSTPELRAMKKLLMIGHDARRPAPAAQIDDGGCWGLGLEDGV